MAKPEVLWMIVAKTLRSEYLLPYTAGASKKRARAAWCESLFIGKDDAEVLFKRRLADGAIRYAKVEIREIAEQEPSND